MTRMALAQVSPTVVLAILDHYVRRNEDQDRVIGTLLGVLNEAGEIEVRNSFPVPHNEKDGTVRLARRARRRPRAFSVRRG